MKYSFYLPKIETRSTDVGGTPNYIIKGYATTTGNEYLYKTQGDRSFKEYFTERAIENIRKKAKAQKVWVDVEHITGTNNSTEMILKNIEEKSGKDFSEEINYIKNRFKYSDIPMFKVEEINVDEKGLFVEIRGNPFYREVDEEHKSYFDSVWNSVENGFINGMSLNFKPIETQNITDGLTQIDDIDIYGISLTGSPSNNMATITEVAMRSIEHLGGVSECQTKRKNQTTSLMM